MIFSLTMVSGLAAAVSTDNLSRGRRGVISTDKMKVKFFKEFSHDSVDVFEVANSTGHSNGALEEQDRGRK